MIYKWCRTGQLRINSSRVKFNTALKNGDQIRLPPFAHNYKKERVSKTFNGNILYEDEHLIAFDKTEGWSVQGGDKNILDDDRYNKCFPVHKIDAPTQGVVILAKTHKMARGLSELFADRKIKKTYIAIVKRRPQNKKGIISSILKIKEKNVSAKTIYKVLKDNILLLRPKTGRKHQLRRHCAENLRTPIVGEKRYDASNEKTLHLLAFSLSFIHPETKRLLKIEAKKPEWLKKECSLIK